MSSQGKHRTTAAEAIARIFAQRQGQPIQTTAPASSSVSVSRSGASQADIDRAIAAGIDRERAGIASAAAAQERARITAVFNSDASRGRERMCAKLLSGPRYFSASAIIAELPSLGTDASNFGRSRASSGRSPHQVRSQDLALVTGKGSKAAGEAWDKAIASLPGANTKPSDASGRSNSSDVWDQAIARQFGGATS